MLKKSKKPVSSARSSQPLTTKTSRKGGARLGAKTSLATKPAVRKRRSPKTLNQKTAQQLIEPADKAFSKYIRIRDAAFVDGQWVGECITCDRKLVVVTDEGKWVASSQNCHFISRGIFTLRYDEENCNLGCAHCNAWRDKESMLEAYRSALADKYGSDVVKQLKAASQQPDAHKRPTKPELLQIIHDSNEQVQFYLNNH
jgi:hypothetical protein